MLTYLNLLWLKVNSLWAYIEGSAPSGVGIIPEEEEAFTNVNNRFRIPTEIRIINILLIEAGCVHIFINRVVTRNIT